MQQRDLLWSIYNIMGGSMICKKINMSLKKVLRSRIFYCCLALMVLNLFVTYQSVMDRGTGHFLIVAFIEVIIECVTIGVLFLMRKKAAPIEKQFLLVAAVLGLFFIVVLPPGQSPDEGGHFMRAYGISEGHFVAENISERKVGSAIPVETDFLLKQAGWQDGDRGTYRKILSELTRKPSGETEERSYNTLAVYNFVCYFPQATAIFIGRSLGFSVLAMAYLAEIFNFVVWVVLVYFAIKIIPKFRTALVFVALLPITIQEATSLAPDALTIGLAIFMIAYVISLAYEKKKEIKNKQKIILIIVAVLMSLCKIVYLPMVFLYLVLPAEKFGSKKKKWIFVVGVIILAIIFNLAWLSISFNYITETNPGVDAKGQVVGILANPIHYSNVLVNTIGGHSLRWSQEFLGVSLGAMDFRLPLIFFIMSFVMLIIILVQCNESLKIKIFERCVFIGVFISVCLLICTSLYVQWTALNNDIIEGIQGRYFLPVALLVPLMLCNNNHNRKYNITVTDKAVLCYSLFVGVMACVTILVSNI